MQQIREQQILEYLNGKKSAGINELAKLLYTSESSIRRDLKRLETRGLVRRVHGGVILSEYKNEVTPLLLRDSENHIAKETVAQKAAELVKNGDTLFIDSSSTTWRVVKHLKKLKNIRVITNSLAVLDEIADSNIEAYCTGGVFRPKNRDFIGRDAEKYIRSVYADIAFISSNAISLDGEISDVSAEWTSLRQAMLARAKRKVFLCDSSKIGERRVFTLCTKDDFDDIICDCPLPWE